MIDICDLFESEFVYIGEDEKYHIKEDAPKELKERFKEFQKAQRVEENGKITLA